MNTIAYPLFAPTNNTEIVAADVRAELAKNNIRVSHLPARIGNSREYWRRRITEASVALDIGDLSDIADITHVSIAHLVRNAKKAPAPKGGGQSANQYTPRDSNPEPNDSGLHPISTLRFPLVSSADQPDTGDIYPVTQLRA